jgi:hypothetical protein
MTGSWKVAGAIVGAGVALAPAVAVAAAAELRISVVVVRSAAIPIAAASTAGRLIPESDVGPAERRITRVVFADGAAPPVIFRNAPERASAVRAGPGAR